LLGLSEVKPNKMLFLSDISKDNAEFGRPLGSKDKGKRMRRIKKILIGAGNGALLVGGTAATLAAVSPWLLNKTNHYSNLVKASLLAGGGYGAYQGLREPLNH
jgi:hypothetical protein